MKNQYPPEFFEPIIGETVNKIQTQAQQTEAAVQSEQNPQPVVESTKHCMLIQYRGSLTDQFVRNMHESKVPVQPVVTLRKIRTFVSQLKVKVPDNISSRVVYEIRCPSCHACYVGQTIRHTCTRLGEHRTKRKQPIRIHFEPCANRLAQMDDVRILHRTTRGRDFLETLEALYIREIEPTLNTKDEWRSRELTILF